TMITHHHHHHGSMHYKAQLQKLLTTEEKKILARLSTPQKIQDFLDTIKNKDLAEGEHTMWSPRAVLKHKHAHCMEGAMLAALALAYHGHSPLLMDLQTTDEDEDHVVALFKIDGHWGAISKTNHPVLRYRDPIYKSVRELAMSYFHEYFIWWTKKNGGKKTLRAYSNPFDLTRYKPERWVIATGDLDWLAEALDDSKHFPILNKKMQKQLRPASRIETKAASLSEWPKRKTNS
uniref:CPR-C4 n=1 Tax=candidate division CPR1 TaxID=1618338 RepID=UPI0020005B7D|nr:Chain A, CPR-C4 [candidate division CPR1]7OB6_B Chain B, CPR-C4 [candidate division CPR1]7OB7_A Chain A, CPR-C4 [candidate division CPR1]